MIEYLVAYLLVGFVVSIGECFYFTSGLKFYGVVGFFFMNLFFYPLTIALWIQNAIFGYKHIIKCAWCNEIVDFKDPEKVQEHVTHCTKHPTLTRIAELENEITELKARKIWDMTVSMINKSKASDEPK